MARAQDALIAVESMSDGVITVNLALEVVFMNAAAQTMTGWSFDEAAGRPLTEVFRIINSKTREMSWSPLQTVLDNDEQYSLLPDSNLVHKNGSELAVADSVSPIHDAEGKVVGATINFRDATFTRIMLLKAIHRAHHDPLTHLPNRFLLEDRIAQALSSIQRRPHRVAVLFLDLDNFKEINDRLGHSAGDMVLRTLAQRLSAALRSSDTVSRLGGDEFVILLPEVGTTDDLILIGEHVLNEVRLPMMLEGEVTQVSASVGDCGPRELAGER